MTSFFPPHFDQTPPNQTPPNRTPFDQSPDSPALLHRFRRSSRDRKIAGVAGGIGRALSIDPVLVRVAFVVLTIFGGSGVGLYALGWLLLPGDQDQASAGEALIGRGRSSVSTPLAVLLCLVVLGSFTSTVTWGLSLLPFAVIAAVIFAMVGRPRGRRSRRADQRCGERHPQFADRAGRWGAEGGRRGAEAGRHAGRWGTRTDDGSSPFGRPALWDDGGQTRRDTGPVNLTKNDRAETGSTGSAASPAADSAGDGRRAAAPSWDPLGAASFAWDLPEPGPVPPSARDLARHRRSKALSVATFGVAVIVGATMALGLSLHWWNVSWAAISASALAVVALGVLISAVQGRRSNLIGVGIALCLATAALTVTGYHGAGGFGDRTWAPHSVAEIRASEGTYFMAAGNATLDLRGVTVPKGSVVSIDAGLNVGNLTVILASDANVDATCTATVGSISCLGEKQEGMSNRSRRPQQVNKGEGSFKLLAHVGTGDLQVHSG